MSVEITIPTAAVTEKEEVVVETTEDKAEVQSTILSQEEIDSALKSEDGSILDSTEEKGLPSDESEFTIPEKFKGKSAEEIAKAYIELEKMQEAKKEIKEEDTKKVEDTKVETKEVEDMSDEEFDKHIEDIVNDKDIEDTKVEEDFDFSEFENAYKENGSLSDEEYAKLEEKGFSKELVDEEIAYREFKEERELNKVIGDLGGGKEKLQEVVKWAQENKTEAEVNAFNSALAKSSVEAQKIMLKGLYSEYDNGSKTEDTDVVLHSNSTQKVGTKGYATEAAFMKDISSPLYQTDKAYTASVEKKLASTTAWSF